MARQTDQHPDRALLRLLTRGALVLLALAAGCGDAGGDSESGAGGAANKQRVGENPEERNPDGSCASTFGSSTFGPACFQ